MSREGSGVLHVSDIVEAARPLYSATSTPYPDTIYSVSLIVAICNESDILIAWDKQSRYSRVPGHVFIPPEEEVKKAAKINDQLAIMVAGSYNNDKLRLLTRSCASLSGSIGPPTSGIHAGLSTLGWPRRYARFSSAPVPDLHVGSPTRPDRAAASEHRQRGRSPAGASSAVMA